MDDTLMEVGDTALDSRFATNPLVLGDPKIQFYAGQPLINREGHALGTLCVIDRVPRTLTLAQRGTLKELSVAIIRLMEFWRAAKGHASAVKEQRRQQEVETTRLLATGIGHQLNNPLMVVQGSLSLAMEELDAPHKMESLRENLQLAEDGMDQLRLTIKQVQNLGRAPKPGVAEVSQAIELALHSLRGLTGRCTIEQEIPDLPKVAMSLGDLAEVMVVLIENAIDSLSTQTAPRKVLLRAKVGPEKDVEIYVQDTGHGIPQSMKGRVFQPLFTTHAETKLGLGLSTARCRVYMSGGDLEIQSSSEQGTTMHLSLPTAD